MKNKYWDFKFEWMGENNQRAGKWVRTFSENIGNAY
jgi:hypothetical protein